MGFSRFYLCDLQVHTPADARQGYGDAGGRDPNPDFARRLVEAHARAGVEVMAVSDHNRVDWYPVLRAAGDELGVYVFPAMEFSVNRCHLLAIWDRTEQGYTLAQQFLTTLWKPGENPFADNGDPRPVDHGQVAYWAEEADKHKALIIAPHATAKNIGMFASGVCTNRKEVVQRGLIAAFDVFGSRGADVLSNPATEFGDIPPRWIISGDVRSFDEVGKRAVYLKLGEEPTLEGIRQAFLMPETRIRFPGALRKQWRHVVGARFADSVKPSWPVLKGLTIKGGFHSDLDVAFGPGLNAVIGGKGTGKSTLIEILRYVLHAPDPGDKASEGRSNREHNFKANAEAVVTYVDQSGDEYEVRRSGSKDPAQLLRGGKELTVDVARRVTVRVFGQRELQSLADRTDQLREFVATEGGAEWADALTNERSLTGKLRDYDAELDKIEGQLAGLEDDERELADISDRMEQINERGVSAHIERQTKLGDADAKIQEATRWPDTVEEAVTDLQAIASAPEVPDIASEHKSMREALERLATAVTQATSGLGTVITQTKQDLASPVTAWKKQRTDERTAIERELAEAGLTDPRELESMQSRARELREAIADLPAKRDRANSIRGDRSQALRQLADVRREKSRLVEEAARALNERVGERVRIQVDPLADKGIVQGALEAAVKGQGVRNEQLRKLGEMHTPVAIATAIRDGAAKVEALGCSAATASKLCGLGAGAIRKIEEADTPDRIVIEVNLADRNGEDAWHDVADVSPGQRATALLALVLAGGHEPLVIDQPEDDLDNQYIYDEVVKVLASVCQSRQVIVATHNANIPILGDAEMVLALDAEASRGKVLACGGLETADVAEWSRKILEGGEAAFQARHRRYQAARA